MAVNKEKNKIDEQIWRRWLMQTARTWDDMSSLVNDIGVEQIDDDHKKMIESVMEMNQLIYFFESNDFDLKYIEHQIHLLQKIRDDAAHHFQSEEALAKDYGLSTQHEDYQQQNEQFLTMLDTYISDCESGRLSINLNVKLTLLEWWLEHFSANYNLFFVERLLNGGGL